MIRSRSISTTSIAVFSLLVAVPMAFAGPIVGAISATTNMGEAFALANAINQSGLSPTYTSGVTDFDLYIAGNPRHASAPGTDFVSTLPTGNIDFNLGSSLSIGRVAVWNFGGGGTNTSFSITQVHLFGSLNAAFTTPADLGTFNMLVPPTTGDVGAQILSFSSTQAQFIRMQVLANNGGPGSALGEIAFSSAAVPEPRTFSLVLAAGLILCFSSFIRRRTVSSSAK